MNGWLRESDLVLFKITSEVEFTGYHRSQWYSSITETITVTTTKGGFSTQLDAVTVSWAELNHNTLTQLHFVLTAICCVLLWVCGYIPSYVARREWRNLSVLGGYDGVSGRNYNTCFLQRHRKCG